jgi:hypothetical protein
MWSRGALLDPPLEDVDELAEGGEPVPLDLLPLLPLAVVHWRLVVSESFAIPSTVCGPDLRVGAVVPDRASPYLLA